MYVSIISRRMPAYSRSTVNTSDPVNLPFPAPHLSVWSYLVPMNVIKFIIVIEHVGQQKDLATHEHELLLSFNVYL